ncbi:MAG: type IX secretion system membrane protein PorP/SprF [Flavobacteriales bacterium]|nr:type IX secretion system membrane protein PorP/SprF [Flavobacteriales bacterium]
MKVPDNESSEFRMKELKMKNTINTNIANCIKGLTQQDPQYSLYIFNQQLIRNPGYAGSRETLSGVFSSS